MLAVSARPWGSLYINGDLRERETDVQHTFTLPAGTHRVRAQHSTLGSREVTVRVYPGRTTTVDLDLSAGSR